MVSKDLFLILFNILHLPDLMAVQDYFFSSDLVKTEICQHMLSFLKLSCKLLVATSSPSRVIPQIDTRNLCDDSSPFDARTRRW